MEEIIHAAKELGINYKIFTSSKTSEFYSDHQWSVIQNSQVGPVINALTLRFWFFAVNMISLNETFF